MRKLYLILLSVVLLAAIALVPMVAFSSSANQGLSAVVACAGAPAPRLVVGATARPAQVYNTLWASPLSSVVLGVLFRANGDTYTVVGGPQCANGPYNWYQVNYKGVLGWITEGTGSVYWSEAFSSTPLTPVPTLPPVTRVPTLVPVTPMPNQGACPGAPTPRLRIGGNARPAQVYSSLRAGLDSNLILTVLYKANGDTVRVLNGPFCGTNPHNWWQVDYKGRVGWVTEGIGSIYWVEPIQ